MQQRAVRSRTSNSPILALPPHARIVLSASTTDGTRVGFDDQNTQGIKVTWALNDEFSFYDADGKLVGDFRLQDASAGQTSGTFEQVGEFTLTEGAKYTVVYPKVAGATSLALYNRILSVQRQDGNATMAHMDKLMRMDQKEYTYTKAAPAPIVFAHAYAMLTLTLNQPAGYDASADGAPEKVILYVGDKAYNLGLTNITWDSAIKAYVLIEPTSAAGKTIRTETITANDKVFTASFTSQQAYTAGKRYTKTLAPALVTSYTLATIALLPTTATEVVVTDAITEATDLTELGELRTALNACTGGSLSLILPNATGIGKSAFERCSALTSVSLPAAASIGESAFLKCSALTSVSLPAAASIGQSAFYDCTALLSVSLPAATKIEVSAFDSCSALTSVSLPAATSIENNAFSGCALTSVSLPVAVTIGGSAFVNCSALTSVSLPAATSIGEYAFSSCSALSSVSLPVATTIGKSAFVYCKALTSVSLPVAATIGVYAFEGCSALTSVSLPAATTIGGCAFEYCAALTSVSLPMAASIGVYAFQNCSALTSVSLPAAATIGDGAFYGCKALLSVSLPAATSIGENAFNGIGMDASVTSGTIAIATETTSDVTAASSAKIFNSASTEKYTLEVGPNVSGINTTDKTWTVGGTTYTFKAITVK